MPKAGETRPFSCSRSAVSLNQHRPLMSVIPALPYAPDDALRITGGGCNTRIALMYRDGGNNKFFDAIILAGALSQLELDAMVSVMRDGEFFPAGERRSAQPDADRRIRRGPRPPLAHLHRGHSDRRATPAPRSDPGGTPCRLAISSRLLGCGCVGMTVRYPFAQKLELREHVQTSESRVRSQRAPPPASRRP